MNEDHTINNDESVARLASVAVEYARAGAHVRLLFWRALGILKRMTHAH